MHKLIIKALNETGKRDEMSVNNACKNQGFQCEEKGESSLLTLKEMNVHFRPKMAMFDPCSCAPPVMHNHTCQISDEVIDIARRAGCNKATLQPMPVAFEEANGGMVKTYINDQSGGTINTAANIKC